MKKLLFTLMLVLVAPAHARVLEDNSEYKILGPRFSPEMTELLNEINPTPFFPELFGFPWTTTMLELNSMGFECGISPKTHHNVCSHQGYKLLPNSSETKIDHNLTFWFGNANENCAGQLKKIVYDEIVHGAELFGVWANLSSHKVAWDRYEAIIKGIRTKYKDHTHAEKRKFTKNSLFDMVYWLGNKIEIVAAQVNGGYNLTLTYRAQCEADALREFGNYPAEATMKFSKRSLLDNL